MSRPEPLRVLLADASTPFADSVESSLGQFPSVSFVGRAETAARAVELALSEAPDIAFIAVDLDGGLAAARTILRVMPNPPKIILLREDEVEGAESEAESLEDHADDHAMEAHAWRAPVGTGLRGVSGYVAKAADSVRLLIALEALTRPSTSPYDDA